MFRFVVSTAALAVCLVPPGFSQTPGKIDFAREVQPIFRQNCIGCHGPNKQNNGLRVDRRSSVLKPGSRRIMPGSPENSFLFHRLAGADYGMQMPPTGPLRPEQIQIIKAWIEQGAPWPDSLANEVDLPPLEPKAIALVETLRTGDLGAFHKAIAADPKLLNARGPEGSTPFMYAVLYSNAAEIERLIAKGADPNRHNDAGATALMWGAFDLEKTRVLLKHGADVNAISNDSRNALMVAAGRPGGAAVVKLLLAHGANTNPTNNPGAQSSPLLEAGLAGDAESMQALLEKGAEWKDVAGLVIPYSLAADCQKCVDLMLARKFDAMQANIGLSLVVLLNRPDISRILIDRGADVNAPDPLGRTPLHYAAISDLLLTDQVKLLLEKGANVNATSVHKESGDAGRTALDLARLHGNTPVVDLLLKAGGTSAVPAASVLPGAMRSGNTARSAVAASLPLLQRTDASFIPKAGCFSCHNQSLEAMTVGLARKRGFKVDEQISAHQVQANAGVLAGVRDSVHQGYFLPGLNASPFILAYVLLGLDAEGYKGDLSTDAVAMYLQSHQMADGHWVFGPESRPPICAEQLPQTVLSMRALQLYPPRVDKALYTRSIQLAADWVAEARPLTTYDLAWKLQGLAWAGKGQQVIQKVRRDLLASQHADGGWGDLNSMESGAYTTGLAMMALAGSGLPVSDAAYQRGVQFLLGTQQEDGSWHVRTRAAALQPYFDNGFPHGVDQWISAAGSSFATMALSLAAPESNGRTVAGPAPQQ